MIRFGQVTNVYYPVSVLILAFAGYGSVGWNPVLYGDESNDD